MVEWGGMLRDYYNKRTDYMENDFSVNYLGYWMDHGG